MKAVSDVIAPLSGEIVAVNETLAEEPEKLNDDPYGEGWLVRIRLTDLAERDELLDAAAYDGEPWRLRAALRRTSGVPRLSRPASGHSRPRPGAPARLRGG